jgi:hypothetical protein
MEFTNELGRLQEMKSVQHQIKAVQQQHDQLIEHMKGKQDQLQQLQDTTRQLDTQLEERRLGRQKVRRSLKFTVCLENIIRASQCLSLCPCNVTVCVSICQPATTTYLFTPCSRVLLEKLTGSQLVKKFPAFYGTRRFFNAFTSALHLSLS